MLEHNCSQSLHCQHRAAPVQHPMTVRADDSKLAQACAVILFKVGQRCCVMALCEGCTKRPVHLCEIEATSLAGHPPVLRQHDFLLAPDGSAVALLPPVELELHTALLECIGYPKPLESGL